MGVVQAYQEVNKSAQPKALRSCFLSATEYARTRLSVPRCFVTDRIRLDGGDKKLKGNHGTRESLRL
jgi:hypothetical protein